MIMRRVPKYGNDDDFADEYARLVAEMYCLEVMKHTNPRFGRYLPGFYSMTCHNGFGAFVGALPSGRRAFQTFANGVTPYDGWDKKGPTATMKSVAKLDYSLVTNGCALNQKFDPKVLEGRRGTRNLSALTKAYFELGGMHVQYNVVGREILLDAKEHPEKYPGLMVRISGYSAYFADLTPDLQDEIINRTEQALGG
jgi:formate C-acetyltransferase